MEIKAGRSFSGILTSNPIKPMTIGNGKTNRAPVAHGANEPASGHELKIVKDATCTFCGCVCDDIDLTVDGHRIVEADRACVLGKGWFLNHDIEDRPACLIHA